nr:hypothetical protein [Candidatus Parabeggiatoa sp.]
MIIMIDADEHIRFNQFNLRSISLKIHFVNPLYYQSIMGEFNNGI